MKKIIIAFTIDHVFRNVYGRIVDLYKKYYIELPQSEADDNDGFLTKFELDESGYTKSVQVQFVPPTLNLPITSNNLINHIPFKDVDEMNDFISSEFPLEIFGYSKEIEPGTMNIFNNWLTELPSNVEVVLISNEISKTKPATLFFLSKTGFEGNNIKFIDDKTNIWDLCDILVTSSEVKHLKPKDKKMIVIKREFTENLTCDLNFYSLFDFFEYDYNKLIEINKSNNNN
jgi:hypothetical protein